MISTITALKTKLYVAKYVAFAIVVSLLNVGRRNFRAPITTS
jgi:hypothetical protein